MGLLVKSNLLFRQNLVYCRKSSILVFSMWVLILFSVFSLSLYKIVVSQIAAVKEVEKATTSFYLAYGLFDLVQNGMKLDKTTYDSLYELRGQTEIKDNLTAKYSLIDEESKINVNTVTQEVLREFSLIDDDLAIEISESGLKPFGVKEELLMLEGITEEIYDEIKEYITVNGSGKININTATDLVLEGFGLDDSLINIIMLFRKGADDQYGTEDDGVFDSRGSIVTTLSTYYGLSESQELQLNRILGSLDIRGSVFSLKIETEISGNPAKKYNIVFDKDSILRWRES